MTTSSAWAALIGAGVGATFAAGAAVVQGALQRRHEVRFDLMKVRRDVYAELLAVTARAAREAKHCSGGEERHGKDANVHYEITNEFYSVYHRCRLVAGQGEAKDALKRLRQHTVSLLEACGRGAEAFDAADDVFQPTRKEARKAMARQLNEKADLVEPAAPSG